MPAKLPSQDPVENFWQVSLCTSTECDDTSHPSVIMTFALQGFHLGDRPTLFSQVVASAARSGADMHFLMAAAAAIAAGFLVV
mmetsp:Transcript_35452/g.64016  ORF Transcript_35452/g.64016 Transcript_35452/m.64016 type:complete len:83 (+) Transcript_35452:281-529(+)